MEAVGLGIGILGLAGLFSACAKALQYVDAFKDFGQESKLLLSRFETEKFLFKRWGIAVGLEDEGLRQAHHHYLDDEDVQRAVEEVLRNIRQITSIAETGKAKIERGFITNKLTQSVRKLDIHSHASSIPNDLPCRTTFRGRAAWPVKDRTRFTMQVELLGAFVEKLYLIVPPEETGVGVVTGLSQRLDELAQHLTDEVRQRAELMVRADQNYQELLDFFSCVRRDRINKWLGAVSTSQDYENAVKPRVAGTCDWIISQPQLLAWMSTGGGRPKILWIHGKPGFGKTFLCARVVQHLRQVAPGPVADFFCASEDERKRDPLSIIRSWIAQLANRRPETLDGESAVWDESGTATKSQLWELFKTICSKVTDCFFVVDGFDECTDKDTTSRIPTSSNRRSFLQDLKRSIAQSSAHILLVSRDEADIRSELGVDYVEPTSAVLYEYGITLEDVESDIRVYSRSIVNEKLQKESQMLKYEAEGRIVSRCGGMFLWIRLLADQLSSGMSEHELRDAISEMPAGLNYAYERDLAYILQQDSKTRDRAISILRWALLATKPLTVYELTEALNTEADASEKYPSEKLPNNWDSYARERIQKICGTLIEIRTTELNQPISSSTVHLVHFSVKEYLSGTIDINHPRLAAFCLSSEESHAHLAAVCLRYCCYSIFGHGPCPTAESYEEMVKQYPFILYSVWNWFDHGGKLQEWPPSLISLVNRLLNPKMENWKILAQVFATEASSFEECQMNWGLGIPTPLYIASGFGLLDSMRYLLAEGVDVNAIGGNYGTALQVAAFNGQERPIKFLLDSGADVNTRGGKHGGALAAAVAGGHASSVQVLIDSGADVYGTYAHSSFGGECVAALSLAAVYGRAEIVELLLECGADANAALAHGCTPLMMAMHGGHEETVRQLVNNGAGVQAVDHYGNAALHYAAFNGCDEIVRLLIENGADVMVRNGIKMTALHLAAQAGHQSTVELLLSCGIEMSAVDDSGSTALHVAASQGHSEVVCFLIGKDADVMVRNETGMTALHAAAYKGCEPIVKLLLSHGAIVSAQDDFGNTALHTAAQKGHLSTVKLLLSHSATLSVTNNFGNTALHVAASQGRDEVVHFLLENSVDTMARNGAGMTALHLAAGDGHKSTAKLLLSHGSPVSATDSRGDTALYCAALAGGEAITALLLKSGADATAKNKTGHTALHAAAHQGHFTVATILLANGANVKTETLEDEIPLHFAVIGGYKSMIRLLLNHGAISVNTQGKTLFHVAARWRRHQLFNYILGLGFDINSRDKSGRSILHHAASGGSADTIAECLKYHSDLHAADKTGWTPLHWASRGGSEEAVRFLLDKGCDKSSRSLDGSTPLSIAAFFGHHHLTSLLKQDFDSIVGNEHGPAHNAQGSCASGVYDETHVCDGCSHGVCGTRYKCNTCADFDFCTQCILTAGDTHPTHKFSAIELGVVQDVIEEAES